ncbi:MAG: hypothetical protein JWQ53_1891, partial [Klenkia sp.]|nr:hypothetical protein [Klenkia sp.]
RAGAVAEQVTSSRAGAAAAAEAARDLAAARVATLREAADSNRKAVSKKADKLSRKAEKRRRKVVKAANAAGKDLSRTSTSVKRSVGLEKEPRRWPWVLLALAVGGALVAAVRRSTSSKDPWTPAPTGDGPVPAYREDPVPSSPSSSPAPDENPADTGVTETDGGTAVSTAEDAPGDATPEDSDLGWRDGTHHGSATDGSATPPQVNTVPSAETLAKPPLGREAGGAQADDTDDTEGGKHQA